MKTGLKRWIAKAPDLGDVIARFPVSVILMAAFTLIIIIDGGRVDDDLARILSGFAVSAYLAFCITIARESQGKSRAIIVQIIVAIIVASLLGFSKAFSLNPVMAVGAVLLVLGNVVIWKQAQNNLKVWDFTHKIWTGALFATVGSIIFFIGLMAIQETLRSLFGMNLRDLIKDFLLPTAFGFLAPLFWLSTIPKVDEDFNELYENPSFVSKAVAFLGTWLLAPLTLIYALILLAYGVKITLAGSLPDGEIAGMTLPFLIVGTLTWLLLLPPFLDKKVLAKLFRKLWFPISLPAAALLAVSVGTRISEYGLTPERIALVFAIIWAIGIGLWFTFGPKGKRDIRLITGSAAALLVLGVVFADRGSLASQSSRFEAGLKQSGIISSEGKIIGESSAITDMDAARKAKGALSYLRSHDGTKRAETILAKYDFSLKSEGELRDQLSELGLADVETKVTSRSGNVSFDNNRDPIQVSGFDKLYGEYNFNLADNYYKNLMTVGDFTIDQEDGVLRVLREDDILGSFDVADWAKSLTTRNNRIIIDQPNITLLDENGIEVRCVFKSLTLYNTGTEFSEYKPAGRAQIYILTKGLTDEAGDKP